MAGRACDVTGNSTLVYELDEQQKVLTFDEFFLIIRSLHSYRVTSIKPDREAGNVTVELGYVCSIKNVRSKLGVLPVKVSKLNPNLDISELPLLSELRRKFGFGQVEAEESPAPKPAKKRSYKESH